MLRSPLAVGYDPAMPLPRTSRRCESALLLVGCLLVPASANAMAAARQGPPPIVLQFHPYSRLSPGGIEFNAGLRSALDEGGFPNVSLHEENLGLPDFDSPGYLAAFEEFLRQKYATRPPAVVLATGPEALRILLAHRENLFPGIPIVHAFIDRSTLANEPPLPDGVIGVPIDLDFAGTITLASALQPEARLVVLVSGSSDRDLAFARQLESAARQAAAGKEVEHLAGLPTAVLHDRLARLGVDSFVVTPGYFEDGTGASFAPRDSVSRMAEVSGAPVYGVASTSIGAGVVGGSVLDFNAMGREAGREVAQILRGVPPAAVVLPAALPTSLRVDWRALRRFGLSEQLVPAGAEVRFRRGGIFEQYRSEVLLALFVIAVQSALILLLIAERRGRRAAETSRQALRHQLAHVSRLATAGELVGSIAHEINQPLAAILMNADAATLLLESDGDWRAEFREILADIRRDDLRASEVIRRLRALLVRGEIERQTFDLNDAIHEVETLLHLEASRRGVQLEARPAGGPLRVDGDRIQLQQVILNLLVNGMDAVAGLGPWKGRVVARLEASGETAILEVVDNGPGIDREHFASLFDSFFTTKKHGMGLGLSIARTIVEAHGGKVSAENQPGGGALFRVVLPRAAEPARSAVA